MNKLIIVVLTIVLLVFSSCTDSNVSEIPSDVEVSENQDIEEVEEKVNDIGMLYFYGESHGVEVIMEKEFELWREFYSSNGMRHLFLEMSYSQAQFLNIWMTENDDSRLDDLLKNNANSEATKNFFIKIKTECPETVFHGVDIGFANTAHAVNYRQYLEKNDLVDSIHYELNEDALKQQRHYVETYDFSYRERMLEENIIREFNSLDNESVMGIFGAWHVNLDQITMNNQTFDSMGMMLSKKYEGRIHLESLVSEIEKALLVEPLNTEEIIIKNKSYLAEYYGKYENAHSKITLSLEYWKVRDAYDDFKNATLTGEEVHAYEFPMVLEEQQIYIVVATFKDKSTQTLYIRTDSKDEDGLNVAVKFILED